MKPVQLPYGIDVLEPYISQKNLDLHYSGFYRAYLKNLQVNGEDGASGPGDLIKYSSGLIQYNAVQAWNHQFYFSSLKKGPNMLHPGQLLAALNGSFGSFRYFKDAFIKYSLISNRHGWIWLVVNHHGAVEIIKETKTNHPLLTGMFPLFVCDLWEHAYMLDYDHNIRAYIESFLKIINWDLIEYRYYNAIMQLTGSKTFIPQLF
ncbi:MAG TPA: superoxide dismutase [Bacteroidales bacterium]|nr:superoxide dismutase [Bacteroidales bacterium]